MNLTEPQPTNRTTRSRRVQPELKKKAEQFLAKAAVTSKAASSCTPEVRPSRKRKLQDVVAVAEATSPVFEEGLERHSKQLLEDSSMKRSQKSKFSIELEEKRLKRHRKQAPLSYMQKLQRAQTQR
jgi:hypothetical protein